MITNFRLTRYVMIIVAIVCQINHYQLFAQTQTTVYTCKSTAVTAYNFPEMPDFQKANILNQVAQLYPNAQVLSEPTTSYNCHGYAYHLSEGGGNPVWINNDQLYKYWSDCYQVTSNPAAAVKIYYTGDHSAIPAGGGQYISKWGSYPLMQHDPHYVPADYQPHSRVYYERQPPPPITVYITGPYYVSSGQTGYFTANIANNIGQTNYAWQIREKYSNGQYGSWIPYNLITSEKSGF